MPSPSMPLRSDSRPLPGGWRCQVSVWVGQDWDKDHGKGCILASISPADGLQDATSGCPLWLINEMKSWTCPASSQPVPSPPGICTLPSGLPNHPHSFAPGTGLELSCGHVGSCGHWVAGGMRTLWGLSSRTLNPKGEGVGTMPRRPGFSSRLCPAFWQWVCGPVT